MTAEQMLAACGPDIYARRAVIDLIWINFRTMWWAIGCAYLRDSSLHREECR